MPHVTAKTRFPLKRIPAEDVQNLVIVSNSSLNLPGAVYGLQCRTRQARQRDIRLHWVAVLPGAGAAELAEAWGKAPRCHFGLTIVNMHDVCKDAAYVFTDGDREKLQMLL